MAAPSKEGSGMRGMVTMVQVARPLARWRFAESADTNEAGIEMQDWRRARITNPLPQETPAKESSTGQGVGADMSDWPAEPTQTMPAVHAQPPTADPAPQGQGRPGSPVTMAGRTLAPDDPELMRIREILVGPYLRDHERRLRAVEQVQSTGHPQPDGLPADWPAQVDEAVERMRLLREEQHQAHAASVAQLATELARSREERAELQRTMDGLRAELEQERQAREDLAALHARAIEELARRLDEEREAHLRLHARLATELDARLERARQVQAESLRQAMESQVERLRQVDGQQNPPAAPGAQTAALTQLVAEAERALAAMQAERQYLAGLLAELGLHLVRHAASPAAASAEEAAQRLSDASTRLREDPGR